MHAQLRLDTHPARFGNDITSHRRPLAAWTCEFVEHLRTRLTPPRLELNVHQLVLSDLAANIGASRDDPLDPSLAASTSSNPQAFTYTAKFNARTGAFARPDGRDPNHVSEYERARRMSEAYFDVGQWEKDLDERHAQEEAEGKKRKRPTKKDLVGQ